MHGFGAPQACTTAALYYIEVAKQIANIYSSGIPQSVELVRLNIERSRKAVGTSEMNLYIQLAQSGDTAVAAAIGKRYLLGMEGFRQDYHEAQHYLTLAADRNHASALAMLGYMNALGLGMPQNLDRAHSYFITSSAHDDPMGHNGLGYIYYKGTPTMARNMKLAFRHFNLSAHGLSSDGMFNLASMYLTGTGTTQSFPRAVLWYTQALERGNTPAMYSLAIMQLNGIGTTRDCEVAVNLLKKVCERGQWVSSKLVDAYELGESNPNRAALLFLKLAEAGHEVSQMNVAHLMDNGQSFLLVPNVSTEGATKEMTQHSRTVAQRYYEMSASQGSASSELRLGDYAYYGWGVSTVFQDTTGQGLSDEDTIEGLLQGSSIHEPEIALQPQEVDYEASIMRYRKASETQVSSDWMRPFIARGSFNLGFMHQFGYGVTQNLRTAKRHYHRCREVDPNGVHTPVKIALMALCVHTFYLRLPPWNILVERLAADPRIHIAFMHVFMIIVLIIVRWRFTVLMLTPRTLPSQPILRQSSRPAAA